MAEIETPPTRSPRWSAVTKLVIALTTIAVAGLLLVRFNAIIGPILMAFVLAYLLHPLPFFLSRKTRLSWRLSVNLIYIIFVLILLALLTWGGVGLVQQIQNLIRNIQTIISDLPTIIEGMAEFEFRIGTFALDLSGVDWTSLSQQVISYIQPILGQLGNLVGTLAGSAATTLGWMLFILIVSYFFLAESGGLRDRIIQIDFPGYSEDIRRLSRKLGQIWNAFLRGQIIIFLSTFIVYSIVLNVLGVRFAIGLALIAGLNNFLPYIGPAINWVVLGLVTYFQPNYFGLPPLAYTLLVLVIALIIDQAFNTVVIPRVMAQALKVHPAGVLIAVILAASLLGLLGILIAAPLLATLKLFGQYAMRKMLDQDPWPPEEESPPQPPPPKLRQRLRDGWQRLRNWSQRLRDRRRERRGGKSQPSTEQTAKPRRRKKAG